MSEVKCKIGYMPVIGNVPVVVQSQKPLCFSGLRTVSIEPGQVKEFKASDFGVDDLKGFLMYVSCPIGLDGGPCTAPLFVNFYKGVRVDDSPGIPLSDGDYISVEAAIDGIVVNNMSVTGTYVISIGVFY